MRLEAKPELVGYACDQGLSMGSAYQILNLSRSVCRYRTNAAKDLTVIGAIQDVIE